MELRFSDLKEGLIREIELLEPFGEANPKPIFYTPGLCLKSEPELLNKNTLRCWITDGEFTYKAVGFNMAGLKNRIENCRSFELAYSLHLDKWYDPPNIELEIEDVRLV
jgi:single-stranded-DNA-specific exonuclease